MKDKKDNTYDATREIKFRVWDKENKQMYQQNWSETKRDGDSVIYLPIGFQFPKERWPTPDEIILMQYTGLKDKNGKEIYEGDIVNMAFWDGGDGHNEPNNRWDDEGVVIFDKKICRFGIQTKICDEGEIEYGLENNEPYTEMEKIGNIYEMDIKNQGRDKP